VSAGALLAVLGLLGAFAALSLAARRWAGGRPASEARVHVLGARRLDAQNTLWLVEAEGRRLLIGTGRDGARLVADLDPP
jgi:hypothetical protein